MCFEPCEVVRDRALEHLPRNPSLPELAVLLFLALKGSCLLLPHLWWAGQKDVKTWTVVESLADLWWRNQNSKCSRYPLSAARGFLAIQRTLYGVSRSWIGRKKLGRGEEHSHHCRAAQLPLLRTFPHIYQLICFNMFSVHLQWAAIRLERSYHKLNLDSFRIV